MTTKQLHILQHSLGCDRFGRPVNSRPNSDDQFGCYRNYFCTDESSSDGLICQELVRLGYMQDCDQQAITGGLHTYKVTTAGWNAMRKHSMPPPRLTRSQRRWACYRAVSDLMSFRQYLRWPGRLQHESTFGI